MRIRIFIACITEIFIFLVIALLNMQVLHGANYRELSNKNCIRLIPQIGSRGNILDAQGKLVVGSVMSYDVVVLPQPAFEIDRCLNFLSQIMNVPLEELRRKYRRNYSSASMPVTVLKNIDRNKALALEESKLDVEGVIVQACPLRSYPYGKLACHIIGYLSEIDHWRLTKLEDYGYKTKDVVGFGGVEEKYDYYLRQEDGGSSIQVDHRGVFKRLLGFRAPSKGKDIQLTIDARIQKICEDSMGERKGAIVMMDPQTGAIIALVSSPGFDPAAFVKRSNNQVGALFNDPSAPLFNRAISGAYPAGSVFKLVSAAAGLEKEKIDLNTTFTCNGGLQIGKRLFKCWDTHGDQNLIQAITHSCDVYFYKVGLSLGAQTIHDFALKFGFAKSTGIELPYEANGFIPNPLWKSISRLKRWYDGDTANLVIGQGDVLTTPLQVTRFMAIFANGGKIVTPYIVKNIAGHDMSSHARKVTQVALKDKVIEQVREGLRHVVSDEKGTSNVLSSVAVSVAGKTGTAQTGGQDNHAWFAGFFPYEKPRYAICVFLEKGGHGYASCLVTKNIIDAMAQEGIL